MVVPLSAAGRPAGALVVLAGTAVGPFLVRATDETARFIATQLELADLAVSRADLARAEVRALRAQISPHFIYNALTTIAAFVRSDPDRARELLLEFADFTRYSFRQAGEFTTLADEMGNIEKYLTLERARFGDRLQIRWRVAPEVLGVVVPFLSIQPLVENAVRHGLAGRPGGGTVSVTAEDAGPDCVISVEDDGIGMDPEAIGRPARWTIRRATTSGWSTSTTGCGPPSVRTTGWSWRPRTAPVPRSSSGCPSSRRGSAPIGETGRGVAAIGQRGTLGAGRSAVGARRCQQLGPRFERPAGRHSDPVTTVADRHRRRRQPDRAGLVVLAVDDEAPALDEISFLLAR